jgi:FAD:protein FMN transferase
MKLIIFCCFCLLSGCQNAQEQEALASFSGEAMTMHYKVLIGQPLTHPQQAEVKQIIKTTFQEIDLKCNKWNPRSELSRLNQSKAGVKTALSPLLLRLFQEADQVVRLTQQRFDPTIEPVQRLWKQALEQGNVPSLELINALAPALGWQKIHFDQGYFYKEHDQTELDFGGIAKGLCIDLICERLQAAGYKHHYVEWGGEIRTLGQHPEGRPWTIYISRLGNEDPAQAAATLTLSDRAVATSGDYFQNWCVTVDAPRKKGQMQCQMKSRVQSRVRIYFHVFDPATLRPLEATPTSIASATVVADSCALADGLATAALFFPSISEAQAWAAQIQQQFPATQFWFLSREHMK